MEINAASFDDLKAACCQEHRGTNQGTPVSASEDIVVRGLDIAVPKQKIKGNQGAQRDAYTNEIHNGKRVRHQCSKM